MRRRAFLQASIASLSAAYLNAAVPIRIGMDSYSVRGFEWKAPQLLDYAASIGLDSIQLSSLNDYESLEPAYLTKVKDRAAALGLTLDAGIGCICPTSTAYNAAMGKPGEFLLRGLKVAKAIGAPSMRCYLGRRADRDTGIERHMEATIREFHAIKPQAEDLGVRIALENHNGDLQAREVKTIIEESGRGHVGSCLDTGNPMLVVEDPMVTLETLAPYVVTTHIRDSALWEHPRGAAFQWVALGDGVIDFHAFTARYRELCPNAVMQFEIITGRPPQVLPYLEQDFWKAFPKADASEFARFVALVKKGKPFDGFMITADGMKQPPAEYQAALKQQQRYDLERSVRYARTNLRLGAR